MTAAETIARIEALEAAATPPSMRVKLTGYDEEGQAFAVLPTDHLTRGPLEAAAHEIDVVNEAGHETGFFHFLADADLYAATRNHLPALLAVAKAAHAFVEAPGGDDTEALGALADAIEALGGVQ